jgi:tetratricopeptide (TPR) repeat protein
VDGGGVPAAEVPQAGVSVPVQAAESSQSPSGAEVSRAQEPGQAGTAESPVEEAEQQAPEGTPSTDAEELSYLPLIVTDEPAQTESEPRQTDNASTALKRESEKTEKTEVSVLESVQKYVSEGRLAEAEAALWRELKLHPDAVDVRESLATLLIRGKRHVEAMALVQQGREMMPDYPPFVGLQARILLEQDETGAARSLLEGHLNGRESDQVLLSMLGVVYQQEGAFLKAQAVYARLLELDRTSAGYWAGLAIALDAANDEVRSLEAFRRALALGGLPVAVYDYARQRVIALSGK